MSKLLTPLRRLRESFGLSITDVAVGLGVASSQVCSWELRWPPSSNSRHVPKYAQLLGVSGEVLLTAFEETRWSIRSGLENPVRQKATFGWLEVGEIFYFKQARRKKEDWIEAVKTEAHEHYGVCMVREGLQVGLYWTFQNNEEIQFIVDYTADDATGVSE